MEKRQKLRRFTKLGLQEARRRWQQIGAGERTDYEDLVLSDEYTEFVGSVDIEIKDLGTRMGAAEYFDSVLSPLRNSIDLDRDSGIWTWLMFAWMDVLAPVSKGKRTLKEVNRWILAVDDYQKYYRHIFAGPYYIYRAHRDNPSRANALLCTAVWKPGEVVEQIASRQNIVRSKGLMEAVTSLYYDEDEKSLKSGASSKDRGGTSRRLAAVLLQLDLTWDVANITADEVLDLLPDEFGEFKPLPV